MYKDKKGRCWTDDKIKKQIPCKPKKKRCPEGVLQYDDKKTGRNAGDPCKDDVRYRGD